MAAEKATSGGTNTTYLSIRKGRLARYVGNEPSIEFQDAVAETSESGKTSYYDYYKAVKGILTSAKLIENKFGEEVLQLKVNDGISTFVVDVKATSKNGISRPFLDLLSKMNSIDLSKEVRLAAWTSEIEGKDYAVTRLSIQQEQDGEMKALPFGFTKEEVPMGVEKKVGKKTTWDFSERDNFYLTNFETFSQKVDAVKATLSAMPTSTKKKVAEVAESKSDLPF